MTLKLGGDTKAAAPPGTATDKERDDSDKARGNSGGDDGTKPGNGEIETVDTANDEKDVEQSPSCKGEEGEDENDDDEEEEGGSRMDILADLREEQRARRKGGGRSVSALMGSRRAKVEKQALVIKGHGKHVIMQKKAQLQTRKRSLLRGLYVTAFDLGNQAMLPVVFIPIRASSILHVRVSA